MSTQKYEKHPAGTRDWLITAAQGFTRPSATPPAATFVANPVANLADHL